MCASARQRAQAAGVPFMLRPSDISIPTRCPVLGIALVSGGDREAAPSLDRLIPALGYIAGNVRVISMRANRLKSDATLNELRALVRYLEWETGEVREWPKGSRK